MYTIVEFSNKTVDVVPTTWIKNGKCRWSNSKKFVELVKSRGDPLERFKIYNIRVVKQLKTKNYETAISQLTQKNIGKANVVSSESDEGNTGNPVRVNSNLHKTIIQTDISLNAMRGDMNNTSSNSGRHFTRDPALTKHPPKRF